ncbi:hypothetical protein KDH_03820 [Dictyobacter sp. S3.2.2.5]|uniref:SCP domain-containing protein n=1 Tax=Dictyobacter halimunensis TaxID=3026934 RepID=A0ABQ6FLV9_9CHLR|nr:hypothetical protein KDH_03820 [Dictyobacter sp. S3.2.2.5]
MKWIIGAALFLVLLAGCGNPTSSTNAQGTDNAGSAAHSKNIAGGNAVKAGSTPTQVNVTLSPKPTPRPKVAPQQPQAKPTVPQPAVPAVVPTTPAVQPTQPPAQSVQPTMQPAQSVQPTMQPAQSVQPTMQPSQPMQPAVQVAGNGSSIPAAAQAVFNLINQERAGAGLSPLTWSSQLVQSAHQHNLAMAAVNQLSHQLPGEAYFGDREKQAGVNWIAAAENIGYSSYSDPTNAAVGLNQSMFAERPPDDGHRKNILSTSCKMVGVDVIVDSAHNLVWLTEDFAAV